ncbi:hypothetical protein TIFTF001_046853 [Ficus carica]|uniref:Uncharacterized protein n=1 Tax=Ficus carica TaxID=3494 RepID=A0AA88CJN1_FICCA|nr:hypothetical protein TIFTF001_046852 [Ficus carica]GMN18822.1 hypothetical protein TIFTF001_046853 [Ficus carica]
MMASKLPVSYRPARRSGLVHGLSWIELAAPTTPWQRTTVSDLSAIFDARRWSTAWLFVKCWDGNRYAFGL